MSFEMSRVLGCSSTQNLRTLPILPSFSVWSFTPSKELPAHVTCAFFDLLDLVKYWGDFKRAWAGRRVLVAKRGTFVFTRSSQGI